MLHSKGFELFFNVDNLTVLGISFEMMAALLALNYASSCGNDHLIVKAVLNCCPLKFLSLKFPEIIPSTIVHKILYRIKWGLVFDCLCYFVV